MAQIYFSNHSYCLLLIITQCNYLIYSLCSFKTLAIHFNWKPTIFDARMQYNWPCKCSRSWLLSTEINKCCTAKDGNKIEMMKLSLQPCYTLSKISCMIKMSFERKMKFKKIVSAGFEKGKLLWNSHGLLYKKRPQRMQTLAIK